MKLEAFNIAIDESLVYFKKLKRVGTAFLQPNHTRWPEVKHCLRNKSDMS